MFCPLCKAEYREGFTECSDCRAMLVPSLEDESLATDPVDVLMQTILEPQFSEAVEALKDAGIPHYAFQVDPHYLYASTREPEYKILVRRSDSERARRLLDEHFGSDEEFARGDYALGPADEPAHEEETGGEIREEIPEDWDPSEATVEIWSGADEQFVTTLRDCCRENAIPTRAILNDPGTSYLYVRLQDESRAREILREITEGTPLT